MSFSGNRVTRDLWGTDRGGERDPRVLPSPKDGKTGGTQSWWCRVRGVDSAYTRVQMNQTRLMIFSVKWRENVFVLSHFFFFVKGP